MKVKLLKKNRETKDVFSFIFAPDKPIEWKAGQFIFYKIPHENEDERGITRHFTISSAPFEDNIMLTSKFDFEKGSSFKKALFNLNVGNTIEAYSIKGKFIISDYGKKYVFIAGGIGITPYRSILLDLEHKNKKLDIVLLYGNKDNEIVFRNELEQIKKNNELLKIQYVIAPKIIDRYVIESFVPDIENRLYYISGPFGMIKNIKNILLEMKVKTDNIKTDYFPGYDI